MIVSEVNDGNDEPLMEPKNPAKSAPKIPAKNAEIAEDEDACDVGGRALGVERERRIGERAEQPPEPAANDRDNRDRAHDRDGEDQVVVVAVARCEARARRPDAVGERTEQDVLCVEHVLEHDAEPERGQREEHPRQSNGRNRDDQAHRAP